MSLVVIIRCSLFMPHFKFSMNFAEIVKYITMNVINIHASIHIALSQIVSIFSKSTLSMRTTTCQEPCCICDPGLGNPG